MYPNINMDEGLATVKAFFEDNKEAISKGYPTNAILYFMALVLRNNIFLFGDTFWIQKKGTATGTLLAVFCAIIVMGHHNKQILIPKHTTQLLQLCHVVDDLFGIFAPPPQTARDKTCPPIGGPNAKVNGTLEIAEAETLIRSFHSVSKFQIQKV